MTREEFSALTVAEQREMLRRLVLQLVQANHGRLTWSQYDRNRPDWAPTAQRLLRRCGFRAWATLAAAWDFSVSPSDTLPETLSDELCRRLADKGLFRQLDGDHQRQVATWCLQEAFRNCGNARRLTQAGYKQAARPGWPSYTLATKALGASSWVDACRSCGVPAGDPLDDEFVERVVSKMEITVEKPVDPGFCLVARPTGEVKRWYDWNRRCWVTSKVYVGQFV